MDKRPIGIFDSGLGGLTAAKEFIRLLPGEDIVYFGDTGRVPYGNRSVDTIEKYARQDIAFLLANGVKYIIAACGTVSSVALGRITDCPVPLIGVATPGAEAAARATRNGRVGAIGTAATIATGVYTRELHRLDPRIRAFVLACPLFVPLAENGWIGREDPIARLTVERYLKPLKEEQIDTLILGCTHFPLLRDVISDYMGENVALIDTGYETARAAADFLRENDMLCGRETGGGHHYFVSDRVEGFTRVADLFFGSGEELDVRWADINAY